MKVRDLSCEVYDIEVFPNVMHTTCYDTEKDILYKFEISERKNDTDELIEHFNDASKIFVGYNNSHYDDPIINYIISYMYKHDLSYIQICTSVRNLSDIIIRNDESERDSWKQIKYARLFKSLDLLTMLFSQKLRVGLKSMQATMEYSNVQEFKGSFEDYLAIDKIDEMISYNVNDVMSTAELLTRVEEDVKLRIAIEDHHHIDCLNRDPVNLGMEFLKKRYLQQTGLQWCDIKDLRSPKDFIKLGDVILPFINYNAPEFKQMLSTVKNTTVSTNKKEDNADAFKYKFVFNKLQYTVGVGGLHSVNDPYIIKPEEDEYLIDCDVASMYPSLLIQHNFYPPHLGVEFKEVYAEIYKERLYAKAHKIEPDNTSKKLALNGLTGNLQNKFSWVYSPQAVFQIRMNGQLLLLMLAEKLTAIGCRIIQANTDGLFLIVKKSKHDEYLKVCKEWEILSKLELEHDYFKAMYQIAINDYLAITIDNKVKKKGIFITKTVLGKGLAPKIISLALENYILHNIPVEDTILNCKDIKKFLMSTKVNRTFIVIHNGIQQQRINRFFASKYGPYLYRADIETPKKLVSLLESSGVTICNDLTIPIDMSTINYRYYIVKAKKIIEQLERRQLNLF